MLKNIILANAANATFNKKWAKDNGITMPEGFNWTSPGAHQEKDARNRCGGL